jgi:hypothetical protein
MLAEVGKVQDAHQLGVDIVTLASPRQNHITDQQAQFRGRLPAAIQIVECFHEGERPCRSVMAY